MVYKVLSLLEPENKDREPNFCGQKISKTNTYMKMTPLNPLPLLLNFSHFELREFVETTTTTITTLLLTDPLS